MSTNSPTVSVIIPTYNRAELLPRALDSVRGQTFTDWEIVLVDDGSTDDTPAVADRYADRLGDRLIHVHQENEGPSGARNTGIDACRGRFVAFLDSDDEFSPTRLERQLELFDLRGELGFVYSDYAFIDFEGVRHPSAFDTKCTLARRVPREEVGPGLNVCTGSLFDWLIQGYFIATIVGLVRREVLGRTIRFDKKLTYSEEWLFYLHVTRVCRAGFVNEPLCVHHYVRGSLAQTDKLRNTAGYHALLEAIEKGFDDMSRADRAVIRRHLARSGRQLGYDALRAARCREAFTFFAQSFGRKPGLLALGDLCRVAAFRLWPARQTSAEDVGSTMNTDSKSCKTEVASGCGTGFAGRGPGFPAGKTTGCRPSPTIAFPAPTSTATGPPVWDRLWRDPPSDAKDDALLERERRSPRWAMIVDRLGATFGSIDGLKTVELGSGRGDLSVLLAQRGARVTLLDASSMALDQARARFDRLGLGAVCVQADMLTTLEGRGQPYDVALSSGVIEHFRGQARTEVVGAHHAVLRPGGMAIISVPHACCVPYRLWKGYLQLRGWWPYGLELPYTKGELLERSREVGFDRLEARCMGFWQSVGDHWGRSLLGIKVDWAQHRSMLDGVMGMTLLLFGRRT